MSQLDREGAFRARVLESGVNVSSGGYPQFVAKYEITELYDEEAAEWIPWAEYQQTITGYHILFTDTKELLNMAQVRKALEWDGQTFASLDQADFTDKVVLIRVEENVYQGTTRFQVNWIDAYDADPIRQLPRLDNKKMAALDQQFAGRLAATSAPAKPPAKAPAKKKGKGRGKKQEAPPAAPPAAEAPPTAPADTSLPETCNRDGAWNAVQEARDKDLTPAQVGAVWLEKVAAIAAEDSIEEGDFTDEHWARVRDEVMAQTAKF